MLKDFYEGWKKVRIALILSIVAAPIALAQISGSAEEEPAVPDWISEMNPADYVLLDSDLPSDLHVAGDISAEARAAEMAVEREGRDRKSVV